MEYAPTIIGLVQVAVSLLIAGIIWRAWRYFNHKFDGMLREVLECERNKAYRQGIAHGWDTHEKWSQQTANKWADVQGRSSQN